MIKRVFFFLLIVWVIPLCAFASLQCEGFLREVLVFKGGLEGVVEKKYVLLFTNPEKEATSMQWDPSVLFVLLEPQDSWMVFLCGHPVVIEGEWKGMSAPSFDPIPIVEVSKMSAIDERAFTEDGFLVQARAACRLARWQALVSGCKVLEVEENQLVEISPDGIKKQIRVSTSLQYQ